MKKITTPLLCCALIAPLFQVAQAQDKNGPEELPRSFVSQLHDVPASSVETEVVERAADTAVVVAKVDGHSCTFDMTQAPEGMNTPSGWLTGHIACDGPRKS